MFRESYFTRLNDCCNSRQVKRYGLACEQFNSFGLNINISDESKSDAIRSLVILHGERRIKQSNDCAIKVFRYILSKSVIIFQFLLIRIHFQ